MAGIDIDTRHVLCMYLVEKLVLFDVLSYSRDAFEHRFEVFHLD